MADFIPPLLSIIVRMILCIMLFMGIITLIGVIYDNINKR